MTTTTQQHVSRHKPPVGVTPLAMRTVQAAFASLGNVAPHLTARMAEKLYFTPRRFKRPEREREYLARAHRFHVSTPRSDVAAYAWGPELFPWEARAAHNTVLLMHGWEGRGTQLGAFIDPLVASGFQVVALDAPAHGRSPGEQTDLLQFKDAIRAVARHVGGVHAVVVPPGATVAESRKAALAVAKKIGFATRGDRVFAVHGSQSNPAHPGVQISMGHVV